MLDSEAFTKLLFYPRVDERRAGPGATDHFVELPNGGTAHVRQHHLAHAKCRLLLFHGNGEVAADYDSAAVQFASAGAELWVADWRGYGLSRGVATMRNAIQDAPILLKALGERFVVMGRSLGAVAAAEIIGDSSVAPQVRGVVIESGATDFRGYLYRRDLPVEEHYPAEFLKVFDSFPKFQRGTAPLLILHGTKDQVVNGLEARYTFQEAGSPQKTLFWLKGYGHNNVSRSPKYFRALGDFITGLAA